jgi:hypothetical protein
MSVWPDWLKVMQLKPRFLFGILLLGILILFMPLGLANTLGIGDIRNSLRPWIGLGTLSAFSFWLIQLIPKYQYFRRSRRYRAEMIRSLKSISPEEWILLAYCLERNQQTITLSIVDRYAGSLVARGILERAGGIGNQLAWPYTIPTYLWAHLLTNREQFLANAPFPESEVESRLRGLHQHICRHDF